MRNSDGRYPDPIEVDYDDEDEDDDLPFEGSLPCNVLETLLKAVPFGLPTLRITVSFTRELQDNDGELAVAVARIRWKRIAVWLATNHPDTSVVVVAPRKMFTFFRKAMAALTVRGRLEMERGI